MRIKANCTTPMWGRIPPHTARRAAILGHSRMPRALRNARFWFETRRDDRVHHTLNAHGVRPGPTQITLFPPVLGVFAAQHRRADSFLEGHSPFRPPN